MWKKKIKQKKSQYIMLGLIVMLSSIIIGACIALAIEATAFVDKIYEPTSTDGYMVNDINKIDEIERILRDNNVTIDSSASSKIVNTKIMSSEEQPLNTIFGAITLKENKDYYNFEGNELKDDTVWVTTSFANDNDLEIGDEINFAANGIKLKISGIYESLYAPSLNSGMQEYVVNQKTFDKFDLKESKRLLVTNKNDKTIRVVLEKSLDKETYNMFQNNTTLILTKEGIVMGTNQIPSITGMVGMIAGFVIFIATLVLINVIIKNNVLQDYKTIGSYKAMGFDNKTIIKSYVKSYVIVAGIFMVIGSIISLPIGFYLANLNFQNITGFQLTSLTYMSNVFVILLLIIMLTIDIKIIVNKIKKIAPVDAFRIGNTSSKKKLKKPLIKKASTPLQCAINELVRFKFKSITTITIFVISIALTSFFLGINNSVDKMGYNSGAWFTVAHEEVMISGKINYDEVKSIIDNGDIDKALYGTFDLIDVKIKSDLEITDETLMALFSSDPSDEQFKYSQGRAPLNTKEIAIGMGCLNKYELSVGDYVEASINGQKDKYLISGAYDTMMNNGGTILAHTDLIQEKNLGIQYDYVAIDLKDGVDESKFIDNFNENNKRFQAAEILAPLQISVEQVSSMVSPVCFALMILVVMFSLINIFNSIFTYVNENRKNFGILKAFGYTSSYIKKKILVKVIVMLAIAILISTLIHFTTSHILFQVMLGVDGYLYDVNLFIQVVGVIIVLTLLITYILSRMTNKVSPSELMEE